jgi:hypothetical protein
MQKSDGNDLGAITDEQRVVTGDVPPADVGSTQRDGRDKHDIKWR